MRILGRMKVWHAIPDLIKKGLRLVDVVGVQAAESTQYQT